jgi:glutaredoxin-like protein
MLTERDKEIVRKRLEEMENPVKILLFSQRINCEFCEPTEELIKEVVELSPKISLEIHSPIENEDLSRKYGIDRVPAIVLIGEKDYGIRFFGIPAGYEFATLLESIILVSKGRTRFKSTNQEKIRGINVPLKIQVFVTPTCPYCPSAVLLANQAAIENMNISAYGIEVSEYPEVAELYNVTGVPKTVINDSFEFVGAVSEDQFVEYLLQAAGSQ